VQRKYKFAILSFLLFFASFANAVEFEASVGMHDFVVSDIKNDVPADGISAGTSHTFGLNAAIYLKHKTKNNIDFLAKAEVFADRDKDHLDPDHIPIWFDFLLDIAGDMYRVNEENSFHWYIVMDNRQNTVSCIEREVRQHFGVGYRYTKRALRLDLNLYAGFYYIELDDDTPLARGYTRQDTDDGEASNVVEVALHYDFNKYFSVFANFKRYAANTGMENLEDNTQLLLRYKESGFLTDGAVFNIKIKYTKYNFDRFYRSDIGVPIVPFDNDTLIQAYVTLPITF